MWRDKRFAFYEKKKMKVKKKNLLNVITHIFYDTHAVDFRNINMSANRLRYIIFRLSLTQSLYSINQLELYKDSAGYWIIIDFFSIVEKCSCRSSRTSGALDTYGMHWKQTI